MRSCSVKLSAGCPANWIFGRGYDRPPGPREKLGKWKGPGGSHVLIRRVEEAFDAIPGGLALTAP